MISRALCWQTAHSGGIPGPRSDFSVTLGPSSGVSFRPQSKVSAPWGPATEGAPSPALMVLGWPRTPSGDARAWRLGFAGSLCGSWSPMALTGHSVALSPRWGRRASLGRRDSLSPPCSRGEVCSGSECAAPAGVHAPTYRLSPPSRVSGPVQGAAAFIFLPHPSPLL